METDTLRRLQAFEQLPTALLSHAGGAAKTCQYMSGSCCLLCSLVSAEAQHDGRMWLRSWVWMGGHCWTEPFQSLMTVLTI